ncbi:MAG: HAMP domain-containing protein, partial [Methylobacteriaceae bacterium]|nr:HAMP domain-containing protein [Methylobacteriaceae bacterium]
MARVFRDVPIAVKVATAFGVVVVTLCAMIGVAVLKLATIAQASRSNEQSAALLYWAGEVENNMLDQANAMSGLVITQGSKEAKRYAAEKTKFQTSAREVQARTHHPEGVRLLERTLALAGEWQAKVGDVQARSGEDLDSTERALAVANDPASTAIFDRYRAAQAALNEFDRAQLAASTAETDKARSDAELTLLVGGALALALSVACGWFLARQLGRPVSAMTAAMDRLARGDVAAEVPHRERRDEIGRMARSVQVFKDAAIEKLRLEGESQDQRRAAEAERAEAEREREAARAAQEAVVSALAGALARLAEGDLACRIGQAFPAEYEGLRR